MITLEAVTNGTTLRLIDRNNAVAMTPAAYRRQPLGPRQIRWLKDRGWIDRRTVTRTHDAPGR